MINYSKLDQLFYLAESENDREKKLTILAEIGEIFAVSKVNDCLKFKQQFLKLMQSLL